MNAIAQVADGRNEMRCMDGTSRHLSLSPSLSLSFFLCLSISLSISLSLSLSLFLTLAHYLSETEVIPMIKELFIIKLLSLLTIESSPLSRHCNYIEFPFSYMTQLHILCAVCIECNSFYSVLCNSGLEPSVMRRTC